MVEIYQGQDKVDEFGRVGTIYCFNAIAGITWESLEGAGIAGEIKLTNDNPLDNGGGWRCFPEQSEPGGATHNKILAQVTLVVWCDVQQGSPH